MTETAQTRRPQWRARMTSGTVDMPTASAPSLREGPDLGRGFEVRPGAREIDPLGEVDAEQPRDHLEAQPEHRIIGIAQRREARDRRLSSLGAGQRTAGLEVDVVGDQHEPPRPDFSGCNDPAALVSSSVAMPARCRARIGTVAMAPGPAPS